MKHTKAEIEAAKKLIELGSINKKKYVAAKDTLCSLANLYIGGTISEKTKVEIAAPDLLEALGSLVAAIEFTNIQHKFPESFLRAKNAITKATEGK